MGKRIIYFVFIFAIVMGICNSRIFAADKETEGSKEEYYKAQVLDILEEGEKDLGNGVKNKYQKVKLKILDQAGEAEIVEVEHGGRFSLKDDQKVKKNDTIVLLKEKINETRTLYLITDKYRLGNIIFIFFLFFLMTVFVGKIKGFTSILGMLISLLVILKFIIPRILAGADPFLISIIGSLMIMLLTIYLSHGFNINTHIAVASTSICLFLAGILSAIFVKMALLTGLGSEEAYSLTLGPTANINFRGLLLGGIIIGTLGVLDDVTIGQAASVYELNRANPKLTFEELFKRGLSIGKEHVASMVNTLILAYAGSSLALFFLFYIGGQDKPFWMILNSEIISEEIVRSLAGSMSLIMAVPITTFIAVYKMKKKN